MGKFKYPYFYLVATFGWNGLLLLLSRPIPGVFLESINRKLGGTTVFWKFWKAFTLNLSINMALVFIIKRSKMYKKEIKDIGTKAFRLNFQWGLCDSLHSLKYWQGSASFYQPCSIKLQNSSCYCEFTDPTNLWITCEGAILRAIWYFVPNLKVFANLIQNALNFLDCTVYWKGLL